MILPIRVVNIYPTYISVSSQSCPTLCDPMEACQPPLSTEISRQEYWSGVPFPSLGIPDPGINPMSPTLQVDSSPAEPSRFLKELIQFKIRKINNPNKNWAEELNRHFSEEEMQMTNKYMKRCSTSLIILEMQIKTTVRYQLIPVGTAIIKKNTNNKCWWGCGEKRTLVHFGGNVNWYTYCGKGLELSQKN